MSNYLKTKNGVNLLPGATSVTDEGDLGYNNTTHKLEYKDNSATRSAVSEDGTQTLTNKTLSGNTAATLISGSGTLTLNTTGTITVPNTTDTLVGKATTDTLTNKTLSGNTATNLISGSGTLTLNTTGTITVPNATDTLVGRNTTDTLTNKSISASQINSGTLAIAQGGTNSGTTLNNNRVIQSSGSAIVEAAAITASRALVSDANGIPTHSTVTTTELGYVSGVTSGIQAQINAVGVGTIPAGSIMAYAGSTEPSGWIFAYGQSLVRASFAALFSAIGTAYGSADGTHFNVPDMRGRAAAGRDDMGGSAASRLTSTTMSADGITLGATGGTQTQTLDTTQIPSHTHTATDSGHTHTIAHTHGFGQARNDVSVGGSSAALNGGANNNSFSNTGASSAANSGSSTASVTNSNTGGGLAHLNVQPTMILNYIIKT